MSAADEVRARLDIVDLVGDYVPLKRAGRVYKGLCPFHDERTPSFTVFPDSGNWRCFGACAVGGDAFDFVMRMENVDFRRALEVLARRVGLVLEPPSAEASARSEAQGRLLEACAQAMDLYHRLLMRSDGARDARDYLARRELGNTVAQTFQLGWAPPDGQSLTRHLREAGFADREMVEAGLARERDADAGRSQGVYDTFRGRLMIPIHDAAGRVIGFGGRTLDPAGVPKYINSPQGPLFDKSQTLFGLHRAARAIRASGQAVVVEGYTDVIRAHASGAEDVVASLGTAITPAQVRLLAGYARTIVLALDADAAGQAATLRGLEVARHAAVGEALPQPTGRGGVRYHGRGAVDLKVARLPAGLDPDDVLRREPEAWKKLIGEARPVLEHLFEALTRDLDLATPEGKGQAAERLLPVVADIPDPLARRAWLGSLAIRLGMDERVLEAGLLAQAAAPPPVRGAATRPAKPVAGRPRGGAVKTGRGLIDEVLSSRRAETTAPPPEVASPPEWVLEAPPPDEAAIDREAREAPEADVGPLAPPAGTDPAPAARPPGRPPPRSRDPLADWILGQLLLDPTRLTELNAALEVDRQSPLGPGDFASTLEMDLAQALSYAASGGVPEGAPEAHRLEALPEAQLALASELVGRAADGMATAEVELRAELRRAVLRHRWRRLDQQMRELTYLLMEAKARDDRPQILAHASRGSDLRDEIRRLTEMLVPGGSA